MPQLIHDALLQLRGSGPTEAQNQATLALMKEQQQRTERRWRRSVIAGLLVIAAVAGTQAGAQQWFASLPWWGWGLLAGATGVMLRGSR